MSETASRDLATNAADVATVKSHERSPALPDASVFTFGPVAAKAAPFDPPAVPALVSEPRPALRSSMFDKLVGSESDVFGLVAYGIYKYSKRDWLAAFEKVHGRSPDQNEVRSFTLGETTERRVATYRYLAENLLSNVAGPRGASAAEKRPAASGDGAVQAAPHVAERKFSMLRPKRRVREDGRTGPPWLAIAYALFLLLLVIGLVILVRTGAIPFSFGF